MSLLKHKQYMYLVLSVISGIAWILFLISKTDHNPVLAFILITYGALNGLVIGKAYLPVYLSTSKIVRIAAPAITLYCSAFVLIFSCLVIDYLVLSDLNQNYENISQIGKVLEIFIVSILYSALALIFYPLALLNHFILKKTALKFLAQ